MRLLEAFASLSGLKPSEQGESEPIGRMQYNTGFPSRDAFMFTSRTRHMRAALSMPGDEPGPARP